MQHKLTSGDYVRHKNHNINKGLKFILLDVNEENGTAIGSVDGKEIEFKLEDLTFVNSFSDEDNSVQ